MLQRPEFNLIDYSKMVPSFIGTIGESKSELVLAFLSDHVINKLGCWEKSVHNMLFYFLTKIKDLDKMKTYLLDLEARKDQKQAMSLDLEYAFNLCK